MKIIVLKAKANKGKTSALKLLVAKLERDSDFDVIFIRNKQKESRIGGICGTSKTPKGRPEEILAKFKKKSSGEIIGITTRGDVPYDVNTDIKELNDEYCCDVIVCAQRINEVKEFEFKKYFKAYTYDITEVNKTYSEPFNDKIADYINEKTADILLYMI